MTTTSGSPPGEGYNLAGAERLSPSVRNLLRELPTRAELKARLMNLADGSDIVRDTMILTARQAREYAKSNMEDCDLVHQLVDTANRSNRMELLKLGEAELGAITCLHNLFHHLHEMPPQHADQFVSYVLEQWKAFETVISHQKQVIRQLQASDDVLDRIEKLFGGR